LTDAYVELPEAGGERVSLDKPHISVGRDAGNDIVLSGDPVVSRRHLELIESVAGWAVRDLGSMNGTLVNGEPITGDRLLSAGDEIRAGDRHLVFQLAEPSSPGATIVGLPAPGPARPAAATLVPVGREGPPAPPVQAPAANRSPRRGGVVAAVIAAAAVLLVALTGGGLLVRALVIPRLLAPPPARTYARVATIPWAPAEPTSVDIGWFDPGSHTYYLADRSNGVVHVVDAGSDRELAAIGGFVGKQGRNLTAGPNGVLEVADRQELWVGDGDGTIKVVDVPSRQVVAAIPTGSQTRVDEFAYDPTRRLVAATVPDAAPARLLLISVPARKVVAEADFPDATAGIEQPAWNPADGDFYLAVSATHANPGGEVDVVNPASAAILRTIPLRACGPHGIVFGPADQLLAGCSHDAIASGARASTIVVDARSGRTLVTISQVGGSDQVAYDPRDERYLVAASDMTSDGTMAGTRTPVLGVIDARADRWLYNIPTTPLTHSVAVDPNDGHVFVPLAGAGIGVFAPPG
jgi:DNA-binding beta-propeller fold protein YncE